MTAAELLRAAAKKLQARPAASTDWIPPIIRRTILEDDPRGDLDAAGVALAELATWHREDWAIRINRVASFLEEKTRGALDTRETVQAEKT